MRADKAYFENRASEERVAASRATHPRARQSHLELAARYEDLARPAMTDLNELFYQQQMADTSRRCFDSRRPVRTREARPAI